MPSINQHPDIDSSGPIVDGLPPLPGVDSASKSTAAATSASSASEGFWYTMVIPPKPASAAARRAWDLSFRYSRDIALPQRLEAAHPSVSEQLARNSPDILKEEEQDPTVGVSPALSGSASQTSMPQQRGTYGHRGRRPFGMTHALASRVEDDYPLGLGASPECELYTMHIDVNGTPLGAPGARLDLAFRVMLDTGSNTTWLLGHNYCGAVKVAEAPQINQQQEPAGSEAHNRQNTHQHSAEGSESRAANHPNPATHRPEEPSTGHVGVQRAPSAPLGSRASG
ncbi:hypothetical protein FKP32DRAFT_927394 [Trametes sanguinea]|nr:hypothetical protein FKP32DRAFT_927394 [Trametes sanguinea]